MIARLQSDPMDAVEMVICNNLKSFEQRLNVAQTTEDVSSAVTQLSLRIADSADFESELYKECSEIIEETRALSVECG